MKILDQVEKKIHKLYKDLDSDIDKIVREHCKKFIEQEKKQRGKVSKGKMSEKSFQKWRKKELMGSEWSRRLREIVANELYSISMSAEKIVSGSLKGSYAEGSSAALAMIKSILKKDKTKVGINAAFNPDMFDKKIVKKIMKENPYLLPKPSEETKRKLRLNKQKRWNKKKINGAILAGIRKGESIDKIAFRLQNVAGMDKAQAIRNARTMITGARNRGVYERGKDMEEMGFKVTKTWMTARDSRVRDSHKAMEGEEVNLLDYFSNDLMYPGDPDGAPEEVYNCRCAMAINLNGSGLSERESEEILGL